MILGRRAAAGDWQSERARATGFAPSPAWLGRAITFLFVTSIAVLTLIPLYWMFSTSIKLPSGILSVPIQWIPTPISFGAWHRLLTYAALPRWVMNSLIVSGLTTIVEVLCAALAGYAFSKMDFPGRTLYFWAFLVTLMIPSQILLIPMFRVMTDLDWLDTYQALVLPAIASPFGVFLLKQYFSTLPSSLVDAARIDACPEWAIFARVMLPLAKPGLAVLAILTFIGSWNSFIWPLIVLRQPAMWTLQLGLVYLRFGALDYGMLMAGASLAAVPMIIIFVFFQRYFVRGLTLGAIKG